MNADERGFDNEHLAGVHYRIDIKENLVEFQIENEMPGARFETPWGGIQVGEESGGGQTVAVDATSAFDLLIHKGTASFFEHLTPGRHCLLLTVLDRTDVVSEE